MRSCLLVIPLMLGVSYDVGLPTSDRSQVFVLGTLYKRHEAVPRYDLAALRRTISAIQPDALVLDVTPRELATRKVWPGKIEYPGVVFPLIDAGRYRVYAAEPDEPMFTEIVQSIVEANQAQGGPRLIRSYDLQPDGTVRNMRVLYDFSPGRSADGMSIDTQGNLYASAGLNQLRGTSETLDTKAGVYVISPEGKLLKFFPIPEDLISNNAFGGPDMRTLYVTAGKTLYKLRTDIPGQPR